MMSVTVSEASSADHDEWNEFVGSGPSFSFYHLYEWRDVVADCLGHQSRLLIARADNRIVGVLPLVMVSSRLFGRVLCSVPFLNYGGPCAVSDDVVARLVRSAVEQTSDLRADYLELRCAAPMAITLPVSTRKISMTIALETEPEALWASFTSKHRTNIRRAYKNDLKVRSGGVELLPEFYAVLERSWRDLGTPLYDVGYFRRILEVFPGATRLYLCEQRGMPVSVAMNGFHGGTVEGMWQGGTRLARQLQANYVLYWEMIQDACLRGFRRFHLGRSTIDSGGELFKSRWNAESMPLYWYYYLPGGGPLPEMNVDNPKYGLAIALWRRLPIWATRRLGPVIARGIP